MIQNLISFALLVQKLQNNKYAHYFLLVLKVECGVGAAAHLKRVMAWSHPNKRK
jgi:hypothetical protein